MIIHQCFGFASRHKIYYNIALRRGTITLWSPYHGYLSGKDPTAYPDDAWSEFIAIQNSSQGRDSSINRYIEFQVGDEKDLVLILACMVAGIDGKGFAFTSIEGRKITTSLAKEGKWERDILTLKLQYSSQLGKLTLEEVTKLASITREILGKLGHSEKDISIELERISVNPGK